MIIISKNISWITLIGSTSQLITKCPIHYVHTVTKREEGPAHAFVGAKVNMDTKIILRPVAAVQLCTVFHLSTHIRGKGCQAQLLWTGMVYQRYVALHRLLRTMAIGVN